MTDIRRYSDISDEEQAGYCRHFLGAAADQLGGAITRTADAVRCAGLLEGRAFLISVDTDSGVLSLRTEVRNSLGVLTVHVDNPVDEGSEHDANASCDSGGDAKYFISAAVYLEEHSEVLAVMKRTLASLGSLEVDAMILFVGAHGISWLEVDADHLAADFAQEIVQLDHDTPAKAMRGLHELATRFEPGGTVVVPRPRVFVGGKAASLSDLSLIADCANCDTKVAVGANRKCPNCDATVS